MFFPKALNSLLMDSAYPLAAQQFLYKFGEKMKFEITQVIGLTNSDAVTTEYRPYKQLIERLNRTYKASYRHTNGFDGLEGATIIWRSGLPTTTFCVLTGTTASRCSTKILTLNSPAACQANGRS